MMISTRTPAARLFATAILLALTPACVEQSVDVEVNVTAAPDDDDDAPAGDSTGAADEDDGDASTSTSGTGDGVEEGSSGGQPGQPEPGPEHLPECGDGLVEGAEECDDVIVPGVETNAGEVCELEGYECAWKRWAFLSATRRTGSAWAADLAGADEACKVDALAAGLPVAAEYRAIRSVDGGPLGEGWSQPPTPYRSACTGERLLGTVDAWSAGFAFDLTKSEPADWPLCGASGEAAPAPEGLQVGALGAWWTGGCAEGEGYGTAGVAVDVVGNYPAEIKPSGRPLPCSVVAPVLCVAVVAP